MDVADLQAHCLARPGAWADNPWDHELPVIKVGPAERGKIFAFLCPGSVGVKAGATREVADDELLEAVEESYRAVVAKLPKSLRPDGWDA
ncbi:MmcQ/YjbR family DNA-binding protein [Pimelobacter simplex]|uniref:MmcQ/YjbR family DNA-binding protein n=1 Tax=Nocardioides simplex TaxID=2045 RepID=UPI00214FE758|nr:hypothetical protein [Pimelobacter simplex]UUW87638.1 hypothetical protein M0M43_18040 [Pimelobacter simplex]UUW97144.1 hypothetical protein M0M48_06690 [Pimelobacter simplex]